MKNADKLIKSIIGPRAPRNHSETSARDGGNKKPRQQKTVKHKQADISEKSISIDLVNPAPQKNNISRKQSGLVQGELPDSYGDNQIYLMARDPHWLFTYWEIQNGLCEQMAKTLGGNWSDITVVLRVFFDEHNNNSGFDYATVPPRAGQWYINAQPDKNYYVEIGLRHKDGRYVTLARSNRIHTPRSGMSDIIDEKWMGINFDTLYALSGGFEVGQSSLELHSRMEEQLTGTLSSGFGAGIISSIPVAQRITETVTPF